MRWFDASPRRATPKGHNLHHLHSTASRNLLRQLLSALVAQTRSKDSHLGITIPWSGPASGRPSRLKGAVDLRLDLHAIVWRAPFTARRSLLWRGWSAWC